MAEFLNKKFGQKINLINYIREIDVKQQEIAGADALLHYYGLIQGSELSQVMVFTPNPPTIGAAEYICM